MSDPLLPTDAAARKKIPLWTGTMDYFHKALIAVAECSQVGNEQHHPGSPLHWDRTKSMDQVDCAARHSLERGTTDGDGVLHATKAAWRFLAALRDEIEYREGLISREHAQRSLGVEVVKRIDAELEAQEEPEADEIRLSLEEVQALAKVSPVFAELADACARMDAACTALGSTHEFAFTADELEGAQAPTAPPPPTEQELRNLYEEFAPPFADDAGNEEGSFDIAFDHSKIHDDKTPFDQGASDFALQEHLKKRAALTHSGVGEGDSSLPDPEEERIRLLKAKENAGETLTREELLDLMTHDS